VGGERDEGVHLLQLGRLDVGERVLLPVHHALLQRDVELAEVDLLRRRAQRLEGVDGGRVGGGADLEAAQVGRRLDRALAVGDVADAVVPPAERDQPDAFELLGELLPDGAVDDPVGGLAGREQERQAERR
jgi:hypothetical protein